MAIRQTDSGPTAESTGENTAESEAQSPGEVTGYAGAIRAEQEYVTMLYALLDQARERSERELANVRARGGAGGTHQARLERDVSAAESERRVAQLNLTERGLCFGRTDDDKRGTLYIGRLGLRDDDYELKLIDWRAPAARPFFPPPPRNPGRMADVVATIQAEQDRVIRADLPGVLVVQGGPGTGKTVAALHRAAYLLY